MVSLQFWGLEEKPPAVLDEDKLDLFTRFRQHRYWRESQGWKRQFNNVQLLIQPFIFFCSIKPWLKVFKIPGLQHGFMRLIEHINQFSGWLPHTPQRLSSAQSDERGIKTKNLVESNSVEIGIQDNDLGIPQNILDKIFAPFFTTKPQGKGTGVGLYFAHDLIVTRNEGQISVDSKLGVYTTFTIILLKNIA